MKKSILHLGKNIVNSTILHAVLSAIGITYVVNLQVVSIYPLILFGTCLYIYEKERGEEEASVCVKATAMLLSLFLAGGKVVLLRQSGRFRVLILLLLILFGSYYFLKWAVNAIFRAYDTAKMTREKRGGGKTSPNIVFLISFMFFLICWVPFWLVEYPGVMTADSIKQYRQIIGEEALTDHHPIAHTMWIKFCHKIAYLFAAKNDIQAYGFTSMVQLILMAVVFSVVIRLIYRKTRKWSIVLPCIAFYGLVAYHGMYSVTMWKDIVHGVVTLLFLYFLYQYFETDENKKWYLVPIFLCACGFCLFRNNGWFAFLLWMVGLIAYGIKMKDRKLVAVIVLTAILCSIIKGPLYSEIASKKSRWTESMSIPLQQIAYCMTKGDVLTDEEKNFLSELADIEQIPVVYQDFISDPVKHVFAEKDNEAYFAEHKIEFLSVWLKIGIRNPLDYATAWIFQTYGYWYPAISYWVYNVGILENPYGLEASPILSEGAVNKFHDIIGRYDKQPLYGSLWCLGTFTWCLIVMTSYVVYKKRWELFVLYGLLLCIWVTLLVATPVYAEFRYYYSVVATMPLILTLPLCEKEERT